MSTDLAALGILEERLRFLAANIIHHANHVRDSADGLKVGGHQASSASMTAIMAALYFDALGPNDRVAVKPHAGPVLHAIHYLLGSQDRATLENFRGFGGAQSYPSRTKDRIPVDFSTGSVGLGVAITLFASLVQDWLSARGALGDDQRGRFVALMGDAELDEGNIYEALIEGHKHDVRNLWWIVDYNRQSLDATSADRMFERFDDIFATCGWRVETLKYGRLQRDLFARPGGEALRTWIDRCPNVDYAALTYGGGAAWRTRLQADLAAEAETLKLVAGLDDEALGRLMTNLGGHCLETLTEAFRRNGDDQPTLFIAYTIKGFGLPFAGHKDNHAGLMNPTQFAAFRDSLGIAAGEEWEPLAGLGGNARSGVEALVDATKIRRQKEPRNFTSWAVPELPTPTGEEQSTQAAFGRILLDLAKSGDPLADRILTTSPDVTVSTNLGAFVNNRGLFHRRDIRDVFAEAKIPSAQKWAAKDAGQHVELGIAESNLFLMLAAAGLSGDLFGHRLVPIGTLYDPFIARGLDSLNYGCYQDARFLLVATPSGLTLGPEGGAHQSINPPLIALGQPGLRHYEPAFADELALFMREAFRLIDEPAGESTYLRLSTRSIQQEPRASDDWKPDALAGGYWLREPGAGGEAAIVAMGAVMPEALAAFDALKDDVPGLGLLSVTSPNLLHRGWSAAQAAEWRGERQPSHAATLLSRLSPTARLVTLCDAAPASLSWLGAVLGHRVAPLGVDRFGQTGNLPDLYGEYRLDGEAITEAMAGLLIG
ncbi:pyruvate dehydrogenase E1 component [Sphingomonas kaistensis]|uniref:Pyruvate dehydrogenase E1 component n=1 Tax=Sphingomonas kaistensis TaxID=298708 RepID=A0A7X6BHT9_9SPHN|nr:transketolase [Sphingomonas kaistensis]NJC06875.1 pyruvate dehydrogenase E1 component [Sphingomonas kaistensis]